jgi:hypothetical protein
MLEIDTVIDGFRRGTFEADCKKMVLTQRKKGGERFEGQGYIRQMTDGTLAFKIYVEQHNAEPFGFLKARQIASSGQLHVDEMLYDLDIVGHDGTHWVAERILPAPRWNASDRSVLIGGTMQSATALLEMPQPRSYLRLHFFEEFRLPLNRMSEVEKPDGRHMVLDRVEFEACDSQFEVRVREDLHDTTIEVTSDQEFHLGFDLRVQEALQFITGKPAFWRARLATKENELRLDLASPWKRSARTQLNPPISPISIHFHENGWDLFTCFLNYVLANTKGISWNPVAYHLYNAYEASANSIDAWAIGLSIAVEALTSLTTAQDDKLVAERVAAFQKGVREWLSTQSAFSELAPRLEGWISSLGAKRPEDTLYALAALGYVEKDYIRAWRDLRNRQLHPILKNRYQSNPIDYQKLLDKIHKVEVLLRQLTFHLMGYVGPFTDYGTNKWPSKQYPLEVA